MLWHRPKALVKAVVPVRLRDPLKSVPSRCRAWPPVGLVRFGSFHRLEPVAPIWPARFGLPVDRVYIEQFLERHGDDIGGEVLEVGGLEYTTRFGRGEITGRSILHSPIGAGPEVTFAADLADAPDLPSGRFDCVLLPQTLLFIYDVSAAVATLHRVLRPGGIALVTVPGITQIVPDDRAQWGQYWSFTDQSLLRLFGDAFGPDNVEIESRGNVKTTVALLHGLSVSDLKTSDYEHDDPNYPLILTVRARRSR